MNSELPSVAGDVYLPDVELVWSEHTPRLPRRQEIGGGPGRQTRSWDTRETTHARFGVMRKIRLHERYLRS